MLVEVQVEMVEIDEVLEVLHSCREREVEVEVEVDEKVVELSVLQTEILLREQLQ